jgi:hypothetical protein
MANVLNDRDILLQAKLTRLNLVDTNYISFTSNASGFSINGTTVTPSSIVITFRLNGKLVGTPVITYSGLTGVTVVNNDNVTTTVTIPAANRLSNIDSCSVTATLSYLGNTYTSTASIGGSNVAPSNVTTPTVTVEGLNLRLTWPRISDIDVNGYEVRATDTGWGTDTNYLYNGSATTCTVTPGSLNVAKTFYIRAYDVTNLYSTSTTNVSYTVTAPVAPTGLVATYSTSSATTSTVNISWNNTIPAFGLKQYRLRITLPNSTYTDTILTTPNYTITASWTGTAVATVYVTDSLGNESLASSGYNIVKNAPNTIGTPITISPVGTKLLLDWSEVTRTSLPIIAYEVRSADTNWGDNSTHIWKGAVSECQVSPGTLGTPVNYYVKAIDSDNIYSNSANATQYTRTAPPTISSATYQFSTSSTGQSNITFNWNRPAGETFAIQLYRVTLTKPGPVVVTADIYANSWTVNADWEGTATLSVQTVDVLGTVSSATYTQNIVKIAPTVTGIVITATPVDNALVLSWTPAVDGSLVTTQYELRAQNNTTVLYRGSTLSCNILANNISIGSNTYYLYAIDSAGKYSTTSKAITYTYSVLGVVSGSSTFTINGTALFKWNEPSTGSFPVSEYKLSLSATAFTTVIATRNTTDWEVPVVFSNSTATLTIVPYDTLGNAGTSSTIQLTNTLLSAPGAPTSNLRGTNLELDWPDITINSNTQSPVGWYEIRDYTNNNVVWKGSESWASISLIGVTPAQNTWYIYAYDYNGFAASGYTTYTYTALVNPSPVTLPTTSYSFGTNSTDSILTLAWNTPASNIFGLKYYKISYQDDTTTKTITTQSNTISISPIPKNIGTTWIGNKDFTVTVVDSLGNQSNPTTISVTKNAPGLISNYVAQVIDNNVLLSWSLPNRTTLPISTVRIKRGGTWSMPSAVIGDKTGTFTTILERSGGSYVYWIAAVDTDGVEGTPISITATVSQPPDYIFNGQIFSTFSGYSTNAIVDSGSLILPVDTTSTWAQHFTNNVWSTPNDQIAAGFPVYIQPTVAVGTYQELFDFGQIFSSTKVTLNILGSTIAGITNVVSTIDISASPIRTVNWTRSGTTVTITDNNHGFANGSVLYINSSSDPTAAPINTYVLSGVTTNTYNITTINAGATSGTASCNGNWMTTPYTGTSMFGVNFRYVKVGISVSQSDGNHGIYRLSSLDVSLDSKAISDSGSTNVSSFNVDGTVANFNVSFVDVSSITLTAAYTGSSTSAVYDFKDVVINGTYTVNSNICTVTTSQAHGFSANALGQKVRLTFTSGSGISGIYAITGVNSTTQYTVSMVTANTSGSLSTYSEGMRIYLFNSVTGAPVSGLVSWAISGY